MNVVLYSGGKLTADARRRLGKQLLSQENTNTLAAKAARQRSIDKSIKAKKRDERQRKSLPQVNATAVSSKTSSGNISTISVGEDLKGQFPLLSTNSLHPKSSIEDIEKIVAQDEKLQRWGRHLRRQKLSSSREITSKAADDISNINWTSIIAYEQAQYQQHQEQKRAEAERRKLEYKKSLEDQIQQKADLESIASRTQMLAMKEEHERIMAFKRDQIAKEREKRRALNEARRLKANEFAEREKERVAAAKEDIKRAERVNRVLQLRLERSRDEEAQQKRKLREKQRLIILENEKVQAEKREQKKQDVLQDQRLQLQYIAMMEKREKERTLAQDKIHAKQSAKAPTIGNVREAQRQMEKEDDERVARAQHDLKRLQDERQKLEAQKRKDDNQELRRVLQQQVQEKRQRDQRERDENRLYREMLIAMAVEDEAKRQREARRQSSEREERKTELQNQIAESNVKRLMAAVEMTDQERLINRKLLLEVQRNQKN